jgi:hypothetical protein
MELVVRDLSEVVLMLARQGIADDRLIEHLVMATGSRDRARDHMVELVKQGGIPDDVKARLIDGRRRVTRPATHGAGESATLAENLQLADLMAEAQRLRLAEEPIRRDLLPELQLFQPAGARHVERTMNFALGLCDGLERLGRQRGLRLRGSPGAVEDFAPTEHDPVDGTLGSRRVRVLLPVVEQVRDDGVAFVIRKGVVEPIG